LTKQHATERAGTLDRIKAVLKPHEHQTPFIADAIEREIARRERPAKRRRKDHK
jgi:hypothetical protein